MTVYLFDRIDEFSDELFRRSLRLLPAERQKKVTAYICRNNRCEQPVNGLEAFLNTIED